MHLNKTARLGVAALASLALVGASADIASATTIRFGTTSAVPTSGSSVLPSGSSINAPLSSGTQATLDVPPLGGASDAQCSAGSLGGVIGTNPAASVTLTSETFSLNTCTDTIPSLNIISATLNNASTAATTATYNQAASPQGTLSIANPTFAVAATAGGVNVTCPVVPVSSPVNGQLYNTGTGGPAFPTIRFSNIAVRTTATSGACYTAINGGSSTGSSRFSADFHPVRDGSNRYLGIFA